MKCCMHFYSMGIIKIYFGKSQENLKKTFLAGLLNYNRKGYPQQTFFKDGPTCLKEQGSSINLRINLHNSTF